MAYLSLYRRRRPLTFSDMTGQEHITRTLRNALSSGRLAHAYLFCGPRGTGKTTTAKILARAMNCEQYPVPEPCGTCIPCQNIKAGVSIDVIEMDAASNRGIDEIRELRERSRFASGESRFKVYIIDEAHMLTPEACNAFLKTLEEPPQNVVFILATTDPSRLPATIVSRCQRFDFHLLTVVQIRQRLEDVLEKEGWQADSDAIGLVARLADGSLRDALGIIEQCAAYGDDKISAEHVRIVTGATRVETIDNLVKAALGNDFDSGLKVIEEVVFSGRDLGLFMRDFTFIFTRLLLDGGKGDNYEPANLHGFEDLVAGYKDRVERNKLLDVVELLHEAGGELRNAHFPQFILEITFIRLLRLLHGRIMPAAEIHLDDIKASDTVKVSPPRDEKAGTGAHEKTDKPAGKPDTVVADTTSRLPEEQPETQEGSDRLPRLKEAWPRLLQEIKRRQKSTAAWLEPAAVVDFRGHLVNLAYSREYSIHQVRIMEESHRKIVEEVLSAFCQVEMKIKADLVDQVSNDEYQGEKVPDTGSAVSSQTEKPAEKRKTTSAEDAMKLFGGKLINSE